MGLAGLALGVGVGSCGGGDHHSARPAPPVKKHTNVDVYASLPLSGLDATQATAIEDGIKLALSQAGGHAGPWRIHLRIRDDSSAGASGFSPFATAAGARAAATDPLAVYYIGELDSGASEVSAPILNVAGLAQVSPLSTALSPGSPTLNPTRRPTFLRLAPPEAVQATAQLQELAHRGCRRLAVIHDSLPEGTQLAAALVARHGQYGITAVHSFSASTPGSVVAARIKSLRSDCVVYAGASSPAAAATVDAVAAANPHLRLLLGSYGVCTSSFTSPQLGGLGAGAAPNFRCTAPVGDLDATVAGRAFTKAFTFAYGIPPDPLAVYGYEAMELGIDAIAGLGPRGDNKEAVRAALFAVHNRQSLLGVYSFERTGGSTLGVYGLFKVGPNGLPVFAGLARP